MEKKRRSYRRKIKWVVLLSNHVDRRDDESMEISAYNVDEARSRALLKMNMSRFSIKGVYKKSEMKGYWA